MKRKEQINSFAVDKLLGLGPAFSESEIKYNNGYMRGLMEGAEWADEHPKEGLWNSEKVCNFLNNIDIKKYISSLTDGVGFVNINIGDIIEDMKKAMKGE